MSSWCLAGQVQGESISPLRAGRLLIRRAGAGEEGKVEGAYGGEEDQKERHLGLPVG